MAIFRPALLALAGVMFLMAQGCARRVVEPASFATPDEAVTALVDAAKADSTKKLLAVVGSDGKEIISSGDKVADRQARQKFLTLYEEKHKLVNEKPEMRTLVIGESDWPFPVPLVKGEKGWFFDSEAGREEVLNRRIGANELSAIQVCKAIGDAQREYAMTDPMGNGVHEYAQKFASDPGKRNGLYWPVGDGEELSPLGELAVQAAGEGYKRKKNKPTPYHGYYYRILTAQGPNAPGGALDYVVNGKMTLGFAVVAYPADYDNSGIMTFIMNAEGVVYQRDLGEETEKIAKEMKAFDPDSSWKKVE